MYCWVLLSTSFIDIKTVYVSATALMQIFACLTDGIYYFYPRKVFFR